MCTVVMNVKKHVYNMIGRRAKLLGLRYEQKDGKKCRGQGRRGCAVKCPGFLSA